MMFNAIATQLQRILCVGLVTLVISSSLLFGFSAPAIALGDKGVDVMQQQAEREFDSKAGAGAANRVEGRVQEGIGRVQRQIDNVTGDTDGLGNQVKGRARRDIGRTQSATEDAAEATQDSAKGIVDSIKGFFGQ